MTDYLHAQLANPIIRNYLILIGSLILGAGLILTFLTRVPGKKLEKVWSIYRGWLIMAPLAMLCILLGRSAIILGVTVLALAGFREFARATGLHRDLAMTAIASLAIIAIGLFCWIDHPTHGTRGWYGLFMAWPAYVVAAIFVVPVIRNDAKGQLQASALAITGFIYFGWMFGHLAFLANANHAIGYMFFLLFAVEVNDIAAFLCGKLFGKRPLRSAISPNKTLEGSLGALLIAMVLPWVLWFSFPHFEPIHLLLTGLIVGIGGQIGDLTISFIKRDIGIKDMGQTIPGHGGILDRIDSMIFVVPLFFHMVRWFFPFE